MRGQEYELPKSDEQRTQLIHKCEDSNALGRRRPVDLDPCGCSMCRRIALWSEGEEKYGRLKYDIVVEY